MSVVKFGYIKKRAARTAVRAAFNCKKLDLFIEKFTTMAGQDCARSTLIMAGFDEDAALFDDRTPAIVIYGLEDHENGFFVYPDGSLWFGTPTRDEIWKHCKDFATAKFEHYQKSLGEGFRNDYEVEFMNFCLLHIQK